MKLFRSGPGLSGLIVMILALNACTSHFGSGERVGVSAVGLSPEQWAALSRPGPAHRLLDNLVGEWDVSLTFWSDPKSAGASSIGRSQIAWVLGKRFVQEQFSGTIAGEEYSGVGIMGYDNGSRSFKTVWADSQNTALTTSSGTLDSSTNTLLLESEVYDPLVSGVKRVQSRLQIQSPDLYTFVMTDTSPEGQEFTSLEMRYQRRR